MSLQRAFRRAHGGAVTAPVASGASAPMSTSDLLEALRNARENCGSFQYNGATFQRLDCGNTTAKLLENLRGARKALRIGASFKGEVIVAGERVRLDETNFDPRKYYDVVSFSQKYFPDEDPKGEKVALGRTVFSKLFGTETEFNPQNPMPPCDANERKVLLEALNNRFETLRTEAIEERNRAGDTVAVRQKLDHVQRLVIIIDAIDNDELECQNYAEDGRVVGTAVIMNQDEEERIRGLLRLFAFMVLQGIHPVPGQDRGMGSSAFLKTLEKDPITQEEMELYLALYKQNAPGGQIPTVIADLLHTTDTQPGLLDEMLNKRLEELYVAIRSGLEASIGEDSTFRAAYDEMIERVEANDSFRDRILQITMWLFEQYSEIGEALDRAEESRENAIAELGRLAASLEVLQRELAEAKSQKDTLQATNEQLRAQVASGEAGAAAIQARLDASLTENEKLKADLDGQIRGLTDRITALELELAAANESAAGAEAGIDAAGQRADAAEQRITDLAAALASAQAKNEEDKERIATLEGEIKTLRENLAAADEKLRQLQARVKEAEGERDAAAAEAAGLKQELETLRAGADASTKTAAEKDKEIAALKAQLAALDQAKKDCEEEVAQLQGQVQEAETARDQTVDALRTAQAEHANNISAAKAAEAAAKERATAAEGQLAAAQAEKERVDRDLETKSALLEEGKRLRQQAEADLVGLRELNGELTTEITDLKRAMAEAAAAAKADSANKTAEIGGLQEQLEDLQAQLEANAGEVAAKEATIAERDAAILDLEDDMDHLQKEHAAALQEALSRVKALQKERDDAMTRAAKDLEAAKAAQGISNSEKDAKIQQLEQTIQELGDKYGGLDGLREEMEAQKSAVAGAVQEKNLLLQQLIAFSTAISRDQDPPPAMVPDGSPFGLIFDKIKSLRSSAVAGGTVSKADVARQLCLFAYYTNIFLHLFFFNKRVLSAGQAAYASLSGLVDSMVQQFKQNSGLVRDVVKGGSVVTSDIYYALLDSIIPYIQSVETFMMNSQQKGPGLYQFQFKRADTAQKRADIFSSIIYSTLNQNRRRGDLSKISDLMLSGIREDMLGYRDAAPFLFINNYIRSFSPLPSITYLPPGTSISVQGFTRGYYAYSFDSDMVSATLTPFSQPGDIATVFNDRFLTYDMLLALFIVLSQRYLKEISGTVTAYCPIPLAITDPLGAIRGQAGSTIARFMNTQQPPGQAEDTSGFYTPTVGGDVDPGTDTDTVTAVENIKQQLSFDLNKDTVSSVETAANAWVGRRRTMDPARWTTGAVNIKIRADYYIGKGRGTTLDRGRVQAILDSSNYATVTNDMWERWARTDPSIKYA